MSRKDKAYKNILARKSAPEVASMFDSIAPRYDLLNHLLSLNIDKYWRGQLIKQLRVGLKVPCQRIADLATGTGELAVEIMRHVAPQQLKAVDISPKMLHLAEKKLERFKSSSSIQIISAAAEEQLFDADTLDAVTIAFGVRNFNNLHEALCNVHTALKPGGKVIILEFSKPKSRLVKVIYNWYFSKIVPLIGKTLSRHDFAYKYLKDSVEAFPVGEEFLKRLKQAGFKSMFYKPLTFGIASIYVGLKAHDK